MSAVEIKLVRLFRLYFGFDFCLVGNVPSAAPVTIYVTVMESTILLRTSGAESDNAYPIVRNKIEFLNKILESL